MGRLNVEVVYATRHAQEIVQLVLEPGARAIDALRASGLLTRHPEIDLGIPAIGIFGRRVAHDTRLEDGDRVEIYRSLKADAKEARRAKGQPKRRLSQR